MSYSFRDIFFDKGFLHIDWKDGGSRQYAYRLLRICCPCASCIDEWSGQKILDETTIPTNIIPRKSNFVGNYAIQIEWSDGHNTGIYSWKLLYKINN